MPADVRAREQPLPLGELVAAPVRAVVAAQTDTELESLRFVRDVGLSGRDGQEVEYLRFRMIQPVPDPDRPGEFTPTETVVSVPLLAAVRVPQLQIAESTLEFHVDVTSIKMEQADDPRRPRPVAVVFGSYSPGAAAAGARPSISFKLTLKARREEEGISRVKSLLADAVTATPAKGGSPPRE